MFLILLESAKEKQLDSFEIVNQRFFDCFLVLNPLLATGLLSQVMPEVF